MPSKLGKVQTLSFFSGGELREGLKQISSRPLMAQLKKILSSFNHRKRSMSS